MQPAVEADHGEIHGAIFNARGEIFNEVALRSLLTVCIYGKVVIKHYPTKTSYNFLVGRKRGWSNKKIDKKHPDKSQNKTA